MSQQLRFAFACAAVSLVFAFHAHAAIVYDEGVSGDLSGSGLAPTSISISVGSNEIAGTTGRNATTGVDRDYFTITVPTGQQIIALIERAGTTTVGAFSFIGVQTGTQVTLPVSPPDATGLLGWAHYEGTASDLDLLEALGSGGLGATDFIPPLPAGDYAFWIQDTSLGSSSYDFDIVVAAPEPVTAAALLVGVLAFGALRCRAKPA